MRNCTNRPNRATKLTRSSQSIRNQQHGRIFNNPKRFFIWNSYQYFQNSIYLGFFNLGISMEKLGNKTTASKQRPKKHAPYLIWALLVAITLGCPLLSGCASDSGWNSHSVEDSWAQLEAMENAEKAQIMNIQDPIKRQAKGEEWERFIQYRRQQLYFHNQEMINMDSTRRASNISGITNAFGQMGNGVINRNQPTQPNNIYIIEAK